MTPSRRSYSGTVGDWTERATRSVGVVTDGLVAEQRANMRAAFNTAIDSFRAAGSANQRPAMGYGLRTFSSRSLNVRPTLVATVQMTSDRMAGKNA